MKLNKLYNMDCLEGMKQIPDGSVDLIICDPPYGTIKGIGNSNDAFNKDTTWDVVIPTDRLFDQYTRILRNNGTLVLFSQEPYTMHLRTFRCKNLVFSYPMIWLKNCAGNPLNVKNAPLSIFEDISVWRKRTDIVSKEHPLREYARELVKYIGKNYQDICDDFVLKGYDKPTSAQHFLAYDCNQFHICTFETYDLLDRLYGISKWGGYRDFCELKEIQNAYSEKYRRVFNLPDGKASVYNVLEFAKDTDTWHPTQKPVALIAHLIRQYSNPGDTVLDSCMGSATTAVAAIRTGRNWIGYEMNTEFYNRALKRIDETMRTPTLF